MHARMNFIAFGVLMASALMMVEAVCVMVTRYVVCSKVSASSRHVMVFVTVLLSFLHADWALLSETWSGSLCFGLR